MLSDYKLRLNDCEFESCESYSEMFYSSSKCLTILQPAIEILKKRLWEIVTFS